MFVVLFLLEGRFGDHFVEGDKFVGEIELLNLGLDGAVLDVFW